MRNNGTKESGWTDGLHPAPIVSLNFLSLLMNILSDISAECINMEPCKAGTYLIGGFECRECEKGEYEASIGSHKCTPCQQGTYTSSFGSTSCTKCPQGMTSASFNGSTTCVIDIHILERKEEKILHEVFLLRLGLFFSCLILVLVLTYSFANNMLFFKVQNEL